MFVDDILNYQTDIIIPTNINVKTYKRSMDINVTDKQTGHKRANLYKRLNRLHDFKSNSWFLIRFLLIK